MSTEQLLHTWWAASATLNGLLDSAVLTTGKAQDENTTLPFATLSRENNQDDHRTNCGRTDRGTFRVKLWHDSHALGQAIQAALIAAWDNKTYDSGGVQIVSARRSNDFHFQEDDGVWQFVTDFEIKHREI